MAINQQYYTSKIQQIIVVIQLIGAMKEVIVPILQFVEDAMPKARGTDKLKAAVNFIKEAVADSEEIADTINAYWAVFVGAISAFAVMAKRSGTVIASPR